MRMTRYHKNESEEFVLDESGKFMICRTDELPEEFKNTLRRKYDVIENGSLFIIETHNAEQRHRINRYLRNV